MSPYSCKNGGAGQQVTSCWTERGCSQQEHSRHWASASFLILLCCWGLDSYMPALIASCNFIPLEECTASGWLTCPPCLQRQSAQLLDGRASSRGLLSDWATTASPCHYDGPSGWWHCGGFGTSHPAGLSWCRLPLPPFPQRRRDIVENL